MSDELGQQIQDMFHTLYEGVDRKYMRPIKRQMFKCGIGCLDDSYTIKQGEICVNDCSKQLNTAVNVFQAEITVFQGRIDRCLMNCQDDVRNIKDESKARRSFDQCAATCVSKFAPVVPDVLKTVCEKLDKVAKDSKEY